MLGAKPSIKFDHSTCAKYEPTTIAMLAEVADMADFAYHRTIAGLAQNPLNLMSPTNLRVLSNTFNVFIGGENFLVLQPLEKGTLTAGVKALKVIGILLYDK